jgi:hypothetical protein
MMVAEVVTALDEYIDTEKRSMERAWRCTYMSMVVESGREMKVSCPQRNQSVSLRPYVARRVL